MTIEAMKQALEALTRIWEDGLENFPESGHDAAITALRTAIAEAEKQRPVAWRHEKFYEGASGWFYADWHSEGLNPPSAQLLYTTPPAAQRQPLTDDEILIMCESVPDYDIGNHDLIAFAKAIEAAHGIKENNT